MGRLVETTPSTVFSLTFVPKNQRVVGGFTLTSCKASGQKGRKPCVDSVVRVHKCVSALSRTEAGTFHAMSSSFNPLRGVPGSFGAKATPSNGNGMGGCR